MTCDWCVFRTNASRAPIWRRRWRVHPLHDQRKPKNLVILNDSFGSLSDILCSRPCGITNFECSQLIQLMVLQSQVVYKMESNLPPKVIKKQSPQSLKTSKPILKLETLPKRPPLQTQTIKLLFNLQCKD
jgi:hypothetical protein